MEFYKQLRQFALVPSHSGNEENMTEVLENRFRRFKCDDTYRDRKGNLYFFREGKRDGTLVLCAHQDKVLYSNRIGSIKRIDAGSYMPVLDDIGEDTLDKFVSWPLHIMQNGSVIPAKAIKTDNSSRIKFRRKVKKSDFSNRLNFLDIDSGEDYSWREPIIPPMEEYLIQNMRIIPKERLNGSAKSDLIAGPNYVDEGEWLYGKFDDALGLALITDIFNRINVRHSPNLLAIFTTQEETGSIGARHAVRRLNRFGSLDEILVIDTTGMIRPGQGFALYENCGDFQGGLRFMDDEESEDESPEEPRDVEPLVGKIQAQAEKYDSRMKTVPAFFNDANIFAGQTDIPTVALEPPIEGMHSSQERVMRSDIEELRNFLHKYVRNYHPL